MGFSFVSHREEIFSAAMLPPTGRVVEIYQVEIVSIQRVRRDSELPDRVGTLHLTLNWLPWLTIFPGLKTIRIKEDLDFDELKSHPTMEFVKGRDWIIAIEDRFGEAIF
ncbi:hypothetical protein NMY22_g17735 [Coprinellus aureogranulatus]|nr:hypothetical protein NMY22_g17735 [Coprinellus aureogranulatus]